MVFEKLNVKREGAVLFVQIAAPPMNLLGPELVRDLASLLQQAEADDAIKVLLFKSADPDYFISDVDVTRINEYQEQVAKLDGVAPLALFFRRFAISRLVTIAQIEGQVRTVGSEFVLACDMRFAAGESAIFSQFEPAFGLLPGPGGAQHPARVNREFLPPSSMALSHRWPIALLPCPLPSRSRQGEDQRNSARLARGLQP